MKQFMDGDFLLDTESARRLYHEYAEKLPIIDYHNHLPPAEVADDRHFPDITELWLGGDHYKWRALRSNGVGEDLVTGRGSTLSGEALARARFRAWAETLPKLIGNPLYHWTHLELKRVFGIDMVLGPDTADAVFDACNAFLSREDSGARGLLAAQNVEVICTTDDPADDLSWHRSYASSRGAGECSMYPTFRPDKAMAFADPSEWHAFIQRLEAASNVSISSLEALLDALDTRHAAFHALGCRLSDHGLLAPPGSVASPTEADALFSRMLAAARAKERRSPLSPREAEALAGTILCAVGEMDAERGWTMQLHSGALRNVNGKAKAALGPDTGFDVIADAPQAEGFIRILDEMESRNALPKTILYTLNPAYNECLAALMGAFQGSGAAGKTIPGKIQFGAAWWFNDHQGGMKKQIADLASLGLLGNFTGMLTDSRSFVSFPRHEYFRRILCQTVGAWMENGEIPGDFALAGGIVADISCHNARRHFGFPCHGRNAL